MSRNFADTFSENPWILSQLILFMFIILMMAFSTVMSVFSIYAQADERRVYNNMLELIQNADKVEDLPGDMRDAIQGLMMRNAQ